MVGLPTRDPSFSVSLYMKATEGNGPQSEMEGNSLRSPQPSVVKKRNWAELPRDVLFLIFRKLGAVEVLLQAQAVCRLWRQLTLEPQFWRCIDLRYPYILLDSMQLPFQAIDRSGGLIGEFYADHLASDDLLDYIADRTTGLRCLVLTPSGMGMDMDRMVTGKGLAEFVRRSPLLEELQITKCLFSKDLARSCSKLRCFRMNKDWFAIAMSDYLIRYVPEAGFHYVLDTDALDIANSMPQLRELQLIGNNMTNKDLEAILDQCLHLESLDIRACPNVKVDDGLREKLAKVHTVKLPNDSIDDYALEHMIKFSDLIDDGHA